MKRKRAHPELNWRPDDLQSPALPLSYTPDLNYEIFFTVTLRIVLCFVSQKLRDKFNVVIHSTDRSSKNWKNGAQMQ
jgi:hypothetical protein